VVWLLARFSFDWCSCFVSLVIYFRIEGTISSQICECRLSTCVFRCMTIGLGVYSLTDRFAQSYGTWTDGIHLDGASVADGGIDREDHGCGCPRNPRTHNIINSHEIIFSAISVQGNTKRTCFSAPRVVEVHRRVYLREVWRAHTSDLLEKGLAGPHL